MESGAIQDSQLSASSEDFTYKVGNARLRGQGGWKPTKKDREKPLYQIDFKINATVKVFVFLICTDKYFNRQGLS